MDTNDSKNFIFIWIIIFHKSVLTMLTDILFRIMTTDNEFGFCIVYFFVLQLTTHVKLRVYLGMQLSLYKIAVMVSFCASKMAYLGELGA